ncbi:MAG: hypothetical protein WBG46_09240 [Nonlabens sp.]
MHIDDLMGTFQIKGQNQDKEGSKYSGMLKLSLNHNNRIVALWNIAQDQVQEGVGFYKDDILVINFRYQGVDAATYNGVVVYKCLTIDVLEGFWSEEYGDPKYLGVENCVRAN